MSAAETQLQKRPGKRIIVSEDLPLTMLTAVASTLAISAAKLDREFLYVGVALSPLIADVIKNAAAGLRKRWLLLMTGLLVLFGQTGRAVAARLKARRDWPISWFSVIATTAVSAVLTIAVFTVPELARGEALLGGRSSTFIPISDEDEDRPTVDDVVPPRLVVPSGLDVTADGPATVSYTVFARDAVDGRVLPSCSPPSGSVFPVGETTVECSVADGAGNRTAASFPVTVNRGEVPLIFVLPKEVRVEAANAAGARVGFRATAEDPSGKALAVRCEPRSGTVFAIGTTRVTCSATDVAGRRSSGRFAVVVEDQTPPSLTLPDRLPVKTANESGRRVFFDAIATDAVDGELNPRCEPASGSTFDLGATEVSCRATDARGNRAEGAFTVDVTLGDVGTVDVTSPALRLPSDIRREASSPSGTAITYQAEANDAVDGEVPVRCEPASGSTFGLSRTTVRCSARDSSGNTTDDTFVVTVSDTTAPVLRLPRPLTAEATSGAGAIVQYKATARDIVNGAREVDCAPAPGSTFPIHRTTVRCTARDSSGNRASESFPVTVADTTAPDLALPDDLTVEATSAEGATVRFEAGAKDAVSGRSTPDCTPPAGATFGFGKTVVTCTAADGQGNRSTRTFSITVDDRVGPVFEPLKDIAVEATSRKGADVHYDVRAVDAVSGQVEAACAPRPGFFRMGPTTVTCTAADARGNTSTGKFVVNVVDTAPPALDVPDDFVLYGWYGEVVEFVYSASASDRIDGTLEPSCTPPPGTRHEVRAWEEKVTVECSAADRAGNKATDRFVITIRRIYIG